MVYLQGISIIEQSRIIYFFEPGSEVVNSNLHA